MLLVALVLRLTVNCIVARTGAHFYRFAIGGRISEIGGNFYSEKVTHASTNTQAQTRSTNTQPQAHTHRLVNTLEECYALNMD